MDLIWLLKGLRVLGFKVSKKQLFTILADTDSRRPRRVDFHGFLHVVHHLQGQDYDTYEEMTQVKASWSHFVARTCVRCSHAQSVVISCSLLY